MYLNVIMLLITNDVRSIQVDSVHNLDGNRDRRVDVASYAPDRPSCSPLLQVHMLPMDLREV